MASMPYKDITSSPPITFVVGPDQKEHTIHSALVARQSAALNALVNGGMKESIERHVVWNDVDEEVFTRFSQFVYTGDYDEAMPSKREIEAVTPCRVTPRRLRFDQITGEDGLIVKLIVELLSLDSRFYLA
ncbi:hypothetical protein TGAM01_v207378 [Trichoderma gamsii]|uniref:BTB domain-containing protein n=1 Tax=Trichoderma gamsii TaxID=398673 RepID=A0A2P4ZHG6_9HYPO|nr:hypothetical protein TGAM01_v207378 [Trichoderma gamsii]PON23731.1 hypothetical protein TGAM01_v207378 [Trichoderma gamsii]